MTFTPNPIDTASVELEPGIATLTEQLARNTHDLWAQRRIEEGWKYGPQRDDLAKTHPGLVAYDELTDNEREYDRQTAIGALRGITALGYRIEPAPRLSPSPADRVFEERLYKELSKTSRHNDFDMNDSREIAMTECDGQLIDALRWLAGTVSKEWIAADDAAKRNQTRHRHLARTAIFAGTAAIVSAILQLAVRETPSQAFRAVPGLLEAIAVSAALLAVIVGVYARFNRRWLGYRHRAESLRMLKFRALDRLWMGTGEPWKAWVEAELRKVPAAADFYLAEKWSEKADFADEEPGPPRFHDNSFARALIAYYRVKRLAYQRRYFKRFTKSVKETREWQHISLWLFFASITCVLLHFGLDFAARQPRAQLYHHELEDAATWFVAFAAIIPVVGGGIRAWFAAFELKRSANLYEEKLRTIDQAAEKLDQDDLWAIRREVAVAERSLREEHYEWLRLLRDAEWFL